MELFPPIVHFPTVPPFHLVMLHLAMLHIVMLHLAMLHLVMLHLAERKNVYTSVRL